MQLEQTTHSYYFILFLLSQFVYYYQPHYQLTIKHIAISLIFKQKCCKQLCWTFRRYCQKWTNSKNHLIEYSQVIFNKQPNPSLRKNRSLIIIRVTLESPLKIKCFGANELYATLQSSFFVTHTAEFQSLKLPTNLLIKRPKITSLLLLFSSFFLDLI